MNSNEKWENGELMNNDLIKIFSINDTKLRLIIKNKKPSIFTIERNQDENHLNYLNIIINQLHSKLSSGILSKIFFKYFNPSVKY